MEKAIIKIKGKEYNLKFTVGFWKKIKEICDVSQDTVEIKLKEDFGNVASQIVLYGAYYGLVEKPESVNDMEISIEDIENELDRSVCDVIEQAIINGMTKAEKKMVELVKKQQEEQIKEIEDGIVSKKKLQSKDIKAE